MAKEFKPSFEMPKNADEALQVLDYWGPGHLLLLLSRACVRRRSRTSSNMNVA